MKKGLFTIGFMLIISVTFISALAFMNEYTKDRVQQNLQIEAYKSILYAFNIFPADFPEKNLTPASTTPNIPWTNAMVLRQMQTQIKIITLPIPAELHDLARAGMLQWQDSAKIYVHLDSSQKVIAYGFMLAGKGLWGTIEAIGAVSADFNRIVGIDFTRQSETPGLGARVLEQEFKYYFRNLNLSGFTTTSSTQPKIVMVSKKSQTNVENTTNSWQSITGATQTCQGVLNMLNSNLKFYLALLQVQASQLEKLGFQV
ncbi:FMN-binding protein [candidate division KSB1 bacterium]|nr:FMN-binding protein [candidate division KSB1 bacterium]